MSTIPQGPKFDPYYKWLGIPKREQPPSHYRLLGIKLFESDLKVIDSAAARQIGFIRESGASKYLEIADRICIEIEAARKCLLDDASRNAYDEDIRKQGPKAPVRAPRQSRYDALQVSDVDTSHLTELPPVEESPLMAALPAEAVPQPLLRREPAASPAPRRESVADALDHLNLPPEPKITSLPPMPALRLEGDSGSEVNTATIIKLVVVGCLLAGGVTTGLLMWMSSKSSPAAELPAIVRSPQTQVSSATKAEVVASVPPAKGTTPVPALVSATAPAAAPATKPAIAAAVKPAPPATGQPKPAAIPASAPSPTAPAVPPATPTPPAAPAQAAAIPAPPPVPVAMDWIYPMRSLRSFRAIWIKGDDAGSLDYDADQKMVLIDSPGELGGFQLKRPWSDVVMTLQIESITGRLEIQINDSTLRLGTATAMLRKPAVVSITYDPQTFKLIAMIGNRQVATATVLGEDPQATLTCVLRTDSGKARIRLSELKIRAGQ